MMLSVSWRRQHLVLVKDTGTKPTPRQRDEACTQTARCGRKRSSMRELIVPWLHLSDCSETSPSPPPRIQPKLTSHITTNRQRMAAGDAHTSCPAPLTRAKQSRHPTWRSQGSKIAPHQAPPPKIVFSQNVPFLYRPRPRVRE
jgi:hypothetical protein